MTKNVISKIRLDILNSIQNADSGHLGPSFSCVEILYTIMRNHINFKSKNRNKIILSKGHSAPAIYSIYNHLGLLKKNELNTLRKFISRLQGHPDKKKLKILDFGTGALGQGLSVAIGYSLASKLKKNKNFIFCLLGDGELQEGQIWEAAMYIGSKKLNNIITLVDGNKFQNEDLINKTFKNLNYKKKWEAFGFKYIEIDGHSVEKIDEIIRKAKKREFKDPILIHCNTVKGRGVSFMENKNKYHSVKKLVSPEYENAIRELKLEN